MYRNYERNTRRPKLSSIRATCYRFYEQDALQARAIESRFDQMKNLNIIMYRNYERDTRRPKLSSIRATFYRFYKQDALGGRTLNIGLIR
jgi:maleate cis-trans isomerase